MSAKLGTEQVGEGYVGPLGGSYRSKKPFNPKQGLNYCDEVLGIRYHRNGVAGTGHWVIIFTFCEKGQPKPTRMLGIVFPCDCMQTEDGRWDVRHHCNPHVSVQNIDALNDNMADDTWRGDRFHQDLCKVIQRYDDAGWPEWDAPPSPQASLDALVQEELQSLTARLPTIKGDGAPKALS